MEKRFRALRFIGTFLKVVAWIYLVGSIIMALIVVIAGASAGSQMFPTLNIDGALVGIVTGLGVIIAGIAGFIAYYAAGESIYVMIAIEENTRLTAVALSGRASG